MVRAVSDAKEKDDELKDEKDADKDTSEKSEKSSEASEKSEKSEAAKASSDDADEESDEEADDSATPEAIARRVAALGEEDVIDRIAAEEERKLAERKASARKGKKKGGGLEVAASKKLEKIGKRAEPKRTVAVAADADPLIERTAKLSDWAKENQKTVQLVGALVAAALLGIAGWLWYDNKREVDASVLLTKAVADERAKIGEPPKDDKEKEEQAGLMFKTFDDRREAALKKYREVQEKYPKTGAAILARLAEGSLLLDKHEPDKAIAAYNDVKASPLAAADQEVKGRVLEGLGFSYELKARMNEAEKAKNLDEAFKVYKELENTVDVRGFKELAMYHQARVLQDKGEADKAKEILLSVKERVTKMEDNPGNIPLGPAFPYLKEVAMDRLREIDPSAAPKQQTAPGGQPQLSPAQMRKMLEDMQKKKGAAGGDPHGH